LRVSCMIASAYDVGAELVSAGSSQVTLSGACVGSWRPRCSAENAMPSIITARGGLIRGAIAVTTSLVGAPGAIGIVELITAAAVCGRPSGVSRVTEKPCETLIHWLQID